MAADKGKPRVSIGLPVFNGENFLVEALDSILAQSFTDYEVIICDNASTDQTAEICNDYLQRDGRLRYFRNERNLGAAPNFNQTFHKSRGKYFKWASHDDLMTTDYIEKCVTALETDPKAVLCHSLVNLIDEKGDSLDIHNSNLVNSDSHHTYLRFGALTLRPHQCLECDGVIRSEALVKTSLIGSFHSSDRAILAELSLLGRFIQLNEPLFLTREHKARYRRAAVSPQDRLKFHNTAKRGRIILPTWSLYAKYITMVRRHVTEPRERFSCYGELLRWWFVNWNFARMAVDVLAVPMPGILLHAERLKQKVFSPEPGPKVPGDSAD